MINNLIIRIRHAHHYGGIIFIVRSLLRHLFMPFRHILSPRLYVEFETFFLLGYWPNLEKPGSFNEKIIYRKLFDPHPLSTVVSDKWAVRQYVISKTKRTDILNEVYFIGEDPKDIPFDILPDKFVVKATHGSDWNIMVHNKATINRNSIISQCKVWLNSRYNDYSKNFYEKHYNQITPRVMVEKFIADPVFCVPLDFKFYCFNGKPCYVQVDKDRFGNHRRNFYDLKWEEQDFRLTCAKGAPIPKPPLFNDMGEVAVMLASDFDFCRVDLYNPDKNTIIFGEITLINGSGLDRFYPREWDYYFGELWDYQKARKNDENYSGQ